jgi:GGDEF domain-containing protein/CheY-like chemotaxis protein
MTPRILLAEDAPAVIAAIRRGAEVAGAQVDAVAVAGAARHLDPGGHAAAVVRGTLAGRSVLEGLRVADPSLPIIALFHDDDEATEQPDAMGADGTLVGPLSTGAIAGALRLALRLSSATRGFPAAPPAQAPAPQAAADRSLELLKRLIVLEVKRSRRYKLPVSVALLALDSWPDRAAQLPPAGRCAILGSVLACVTGAMRDIDMAVPFPDDRIVVLMPHTDREGGLQVAGRFVSRIRLLTLPVEVTASAGLAAHEGDGQEAVSFAGLVKRAAEALSRARAQGGDQAVAADAARRRERIVMG